ncbi:MAG: hypothetical protein PHV49_03420 [Alistipes sp.]|nr:hypothetical protein [Alistipes sp.]
MIRVFLATVGLCVCAESTLKAQTELEVNLGADLVSGYVWRGVYQAGSGVSVQPSLGLSYKGFSIGAWGSTSFSEGFKELDLSAGYSVGGFSIGVTDYWWAGQGIPFYGDYLNTHLIEGTLGYHFGEKFPLYVTWSTMLAGNMDKVDGKRKYSTYIEVGYDFQIKGVDFTCAVGVAPWDSPAWLIPRYGDTGFQVSNISLKASKAIKITKNYALPIFVQAIASPATDDAHLVFGLSF